MNDSITLVSYPDDILEESLRILLVDLASDQSEIISNSLLTLNDHPRIVIYNWIDGEDLPWLFDKTLKSDIIIFNADSRNQTLVGYFAAKASSYYFGNLKSLAIVKKTAIYDVRQCCDLLESVFKKYGKN
jgi:hypothetical protein